MSVLEDIAPGLTKFIFNFLGEEKVHDMGGEFLSTSYEASNPIFNQIDDVVHGSELFNAWIWFDYLYKGKSMLEWYALKSNDLPKSTKLGLEQLVETQHFSYFEFGAVKPGNIECIDLIGGTHYRVREYSLASQVKTGQSCLLRIFLNGNHWEISMPNGSVFPVTADDEEMLKDIIAELPERITTKDTTGYQRLLLELGLVTDEPHSRTMRERPDKKEAADYLIKVVKEAGIDKYITTEKALEAIELDYYDKSKEEPLAPSKSIRMLMGLADKDGTDDVPKVMIAAGDYWNSLALPKDIKKAAKEDSPDIKVGKYHHNEWQAFAQKAEQQYKTSTTEGYKKAVAIYNEMFANMSENFLVAPSVYRSVTNVALAYLYTGNLLMGRGLIERALSMCPEYGLAAMAKIKLDDGEFDNFALQAGAEREEAAKDSGDVPFGKTADEDELRELSDSELLNRFSKCGAAINLDTFKSLAGKYTEQYDVVEALEPRSGNEGYVYGMLIVARKRWAPEVVWSDDIHGGMADLVDSILGIDSNAISVDIAVNNLLKMLERASDGVFSSWAESSEYSADRLSLPYGTDLLDGHDDVYKDALTINSIILKHTHDPIFRAPLMIQKITSEPDVAKRMSEIYKQAKKLKYDHGSMLLFGDILHIDSPKEAIYAYELAVEALDARVKKKKWLFKPYSEVPLIEVYEILEDKLVKLYEKDGDSREKIRELEDKIKKLQEDERLRGVDVDKEMDDFYEEMLQERYADNPILKYLDWFDSLGIDLTSGDSFGMYYGKRINTKTVINDKKVGRNEPCPCGALKEDSKKPKKFKNCHGRAIN